MFALIRAIAIAGTTALAFGLNLSHGSWMPIAAIVAMKASLDQTTVVATQRLAGALIGAVAAALLLLPASEHGLRLFAVTRGLEVVALVILINGVAIRFWNYALYCGAIAAGVLILIDLPHPSNYAAEGYRVLWTLCGVGIGVLVMLLAGLLARRSAKTPPNQSRNQRDRIRSVRADADSLHHSRTPPSSRSGHMAPAIRGQVRRGARR
jgi:uncharacterized membrane protein YccC